MFIIINFAGSWRYFEKIICQVCSVCSNLLSLNLLSLHPLHEPPMNSDGTPKSAMLNGKLCTVTGGSFVCFRSMCIVLTFII